MGLDEPIGHMIHELRPESGLYVPTGQLKHVLPEFKLYEPVALIVQSQKKMSRIHMILGQVNSRHDTKLTYPADTLSGVASGPPSGL